jgi:hypothetical protein
MGRSVLMEKETLPNRAAGVIGWIWAIIAGGGGLWYLWTQGPWMLTHGWFALCSGLSACPLTAQFLNKYAGVRVSGWMQLFLAVLFFIAGKIALKRGF